MTSSLRNNYVSEAKIAKQYGNYDKMMSAMKNLASLNIELTEDERNLLYCAFRGEMGLRRTHDQLLRAQNLDIDKKVVSEITKVCDDMISLIDKHLLRSSRNVKSLVLYYMIKGDSYRYLAESNTTWERRDFVRRSWVAYNKANKLAEANLFASSCLRLAVALNMSVLMADMMDQKIKAILQATYAYNVAASQMDDESLSETESQSILKLLKNNIAAWTDDV